MSPREDADRGQRPGAVVLALYACLVLGTGVGVLTALLVPPSACLTALGLGLVALCMVRRRSRR
jgi:hypothetical protein